MRKRTWMICMMLVSMAGMLPRRSPLKPFGTLPSGQQVPFQLMTSKDGEASRTLGTGCTWSDVPGSRWRMSMADDRAAVKLDGDAHRVEACQGR